MSCRLANSEPTILLLVTIFSGLADCENHSEMKCHLVELTDTDNSIAQAQNVSVSTVP